MDYVKQFRIPFAGLKTGNHRFHFSIDKEFLIYYKISEIDGINAKIDLLLNRQTNLLTLNFNLDGEVNTLCDRCGDDLSLSIKTSQELFVKFGPELKEESENVIIIPNYETELEISHFIYEFITFAIPFKKLHSEGKCNKESLKKLNEIKEESEKKDNIDPRWKALEKLKLENGQADSK